MAHRNRVTTLVMRNLVLALLSLLLGFISWWYLTNKVEGERRITLTVEFKVPPGTNYAPQPAIETVKDGVLTPVEKIEAEVRIRGLKDKVSQLDAASLKLEAKVEQQDWPGFTVDSTVLVGLDSGLTARVVNPAIYHVNFAKQFTAQVSIKLDYNKEDFDAGGQYHDDWADTFVYDIYPRKVTVSGREDQLGSPDTTVFLKTQKLKLTPDDVKAGLWKKQGKIELSEDAELVDSRGQVKPIKIHPEIKEIAYDVTIETRPEKGTVKIPVQVLPPVDRGRPGTADAYDTYVLAEGAPREVTVAYTRPRKSGREMDAAHVFAFVNVSQPGNLTNLPINIYTSYNDPRIHIGLAAGADNNLPTATVKLIPADVGATVRAQGPFPIRPIFAQADRRYQVILLPQSLDNLQAHGSFKSLGGNPVSADEISLLVDIPQGAFSGHEFEQDLPLLVIKSDRITSLTDAAGKPLPPVKVRVIPPTWVPDSKPQLIGEVALEVVYPQNFQLRIQLAQTKVAVSAASAKDVIDALRPDMLVAVVRPTPDDDRPDTTGKARVVGVYRKIVDKIDGKVVGLEPVPEVQFFPADRVEFKTEKVSSGEHSLLPPERVPPPPPPASGNGKKQPPPPPYGS